MERIELWTDGSAGPTNPGPGGWSVTSETEPIAYGYFERTTNILMEGWAIYEAFRIAHGSTQLIHPDRPAVIRTDSQFWVNAVTQWAPGWRRRGWVNSKNEPIKNQEFVQSLLEWWEAVRPFTQLTWVRGHNGNRGNETADYWANHARREVANKYAAIE